MRGLRDRLWQGLQTGVGGVRWNGDPARTLPNTLNVEFSGIAGEVLLQALDLEGVSVSAGAACHSGSIEPSKTLLAMGRTPDEARGSLRFSLGQGVDAAQIERVVELLGKLVPRIRALGAP
jgi:cysteine desulfurase